jgi:pre-mRNA-splicing factor 38B
LLAVEKVAERAAKHFNNQQRMNYFQTLGSEVMGLYGDADNPTTWYRAVVDRVITRDAEGFVLTHPKFVVTFTEYGNTETITLGELDVLDGNWRNEDPPTDHSRREDLYDEVRRRNHMLSQSSAPRRHQLHDDMPSRKPPPTQASREQKTAEPKFQPPAPKKRSAEEMAAIAEKKRKLAAKYG